MKKKVKWLSRKSWKTFRSAGMLWWANRILHVFGWALVVDIDKKGRVKEVYPARCRYRGFCEDAEGKGFEKVTKFFTKNAKQLLKDTEL